MAENTAIAWTDNTFNPWIGCSKVHAGCTHCYAEADMATRRKRVVWGPNGTRSKTSEANWLLPLRWNEQARKVGKRTRVFCASLADVFEDWTGPILDHQNQRLAFDPRDHDLFRRHRPYPCPDGSCLPPADFQWTTMADLRADLFRLIEQTPYLDWQLLTKRPENIRRMWPQVGFPDAGVPGTLGRRLYLDNVWIGYSASDQPTLATGLTRLLECRDLSPVLFLSLEPLLGPVSLSPWAVSDPVIPTGRLRGLRWVIVGGESGPGARPCELDWIRSIVRQCKSAGVPCFVKQLGAAASDPVNGIAGASLVVPEEASPLISLRLRDRKGGDMEEWPETLRVREFPR